MNQSINLNSAGPEPGPWDCSNERREDDRWGSAVGSG